MNTFGINCSPGSRDAAITLPSGSILIESGGGGGHIAVCVYISSLDFLQEFQLLHHDVVMWHGMTCAIGILRLPPPD